MIDNTKNNPESLPPVGIGGLVISGDAVFAYRLLAIRSALRLEMLGMKRKGRSALSAANEVMQTSIRNKEECFKHFTAHLVLLGILVPAKARNN